jgi:hypothetical protein
MCAILLVCGDAFGDSHTSPLLLITDEEAKQPAVTSDGVTPRAGVTRAPKIMLLSPEAGASVMPRFHLKLKFRTFGGARVDVGSVTITYLRNPAIDLTQRLKGAIQAEGIDVADVQLPPGVHDIGVGLKDSAGRFGSANFTFKVKPQ